MAQNQFSRTETDLSKKVIEKVELKPLNGNLYSLCVSAYRLENGFRYGDTFIITLIEDQVHQLKKELEKVVREKKTFLEAIEVMDN